MKERAYDKNEDRERGLKKGVLGKKEDNRETAI